MVQPPSLEFGPGDRQYAPATQRNREPILAVLQQVLPPEGTILEIASGTGEHAVFFAPRLAPRRWLPSDPNPVALASITAWRESVAAEQLYPPLMLDVHACPWPVETSDFAAGPIVAIACINMIHIAPWSACLSLFAGAGRILPQGGILYLYGPYKQHGQHTAPSNATFDLSLQTQNPDWGVRDLEAVVAIATAEHFTLLQTVPMPANNLSVVFQRQEQG